MRRVINNQVDWLTGELRRNQLPKPFDVGLVERIVRVQSVPQTIPIDEFLEASRGILSDVDRHQSVRARQ
jgi:hypothetical protein